MLALRGRRLLLVLLATAVPIAWFICDAVQRTTHRGFAMLFLGVLAALTAMPAALWLLLHRFVLRGMRQLHDATLAFARGSREARVGDLRGSAPEIIRLGQVIDELIETVSAQQKDLERALDQRTSLLKEVHHRVKNNLQIIISMLNLQARAARDPQLSLALAEAAGRVNALALVHRRLYESHDLDHIDLDWLLRDLAAELLRIARGGQRQIRIDVSGPRCFITAQLAVPIGLLVTEAVTNALKHAFAGRDRGHVAIRVTIAGAEATISVCDDGIGLEPGGHTAGLGITLMEGFARQLEGVLHVGSQSGTMVRIAFPSRHLQTDATPAGQPAAGPEGAVTRTNEL